MSPKADNIYTVGTGSLQMIETFFSTSLCFGREQNCEGHEPQSGQYLNSWDRVVTTQSPVSTTNHSLPLLRLKCTQPVWPGIQPGAGKPILARGGFKLQPSKAYSLHLTALWSGRGLCATGHCGGSLFCNGLGGTPPATLAEKTLGNEQDFNAVSLVDGYNLAISITTIKGSGKCSYAGCVSDLHDVPSWTSNQKQASNGAIPGTNNRASRSKNKLLDRIVAVDADFDASARPLLWIPISTLRPDWKKAVDADDSSDEENERAVELFGV
uniref:Thaumatin-like protein n=1 Tax=Quercus lobata TaxID=97700 RepID=A0A7N2LSI2_QUELO